MERNVSERTKRDETERTLAGETRENRERERNVVTRHPVVRIVKRDHGEIIETKQVDRALVNSRVYSRVRVVVL